MSVYEGGEVSIMASGARTITWRRVAVRIWTHLRLCWAEGYGKGALAALACCLLIRQPWVGAVQAAGKAGLGFSLIVSVLTLFIGVHELLDADLARRGEYRFKVASYAPMPALWLRMAVGNVFVALLNVDILIGIPWL